jgi:hypothetical protein
MGPTPCCQEKKQEFVGPGLLLPVLWARFGFSFHIPCYRPGKKNLNHKSLAETRGPTNPHGCRIQTAEGHPWKERSGTDNQEPSDGFADGNT